VGPEVLIPRPETEILVERTIELALCVLRFAPCVKILELGTGSGCIAISLAKFLTDVEITATDISVKALEIAKSNAVLNNVSGKINFFQNDLLTHNPQLTTQNDIIVCNPPYIPTSEISRLQPEVQQEPRLALDGGRDGLDFYRRIIKTVPRYLQRGGYLIMEMGYKQCQAIEKIIVDSERLSILEVIKDYSGIERMMVVQKNY
jgi:release factor glutamine methyltransferase